MALLYRFLRAVQSLVFFLLAVAVLTGSSLMNASTTDLARVFTRPFEFDYVDWTVNAIGVKLAQASLGTPFYFKEPDRHQIVADYLELISQILDYEDRLNLIYSDPQIHDPVSTSAGLRAALEALYTREDQLAPLAEATLEAQISATVADMGLSTGGQPIPPVLFHISPLPYNLIISPRDKIEEEAAISLVPDLTVDRQAAIENEVDNGLDVSSLVVPVGGIGTYPTMVMHTTAFQWLASTIAHEWTHNWLTLRPLGLNYDSSPEVRTMNETTADISGTEISAAMLKRYYPELASEYIDSSVSLNASAADQPPFDIRAEMHATRVHVDALLAEGKVTEAEAYMEQRRLFFWDNGYPIRKLNQAYFAFYGAYADVPGGPAGEDPVGPAVRELRARSQSLADFLNRIAAMSTFQELQAALAQ